MQELTLYYFSKHISAFLTYAWKMGLLFSCLYKSHCQAIGAPPVRKRTSLLTDIVLAHVTCFVPWHKRDMIDTLSEQKLLEHCVCVFCLLSYSFFYSTRKECLFQPGSQSPGMKRKWKRACAMQNWPPRPLFPDVPLIMFWYKARVLLRMQFRFLISWLQDRNSIQVGLT